VRDDAAALIEACRLAPEDDAPRLVWADHVGGARGELVVVQCDLARGGLSVSEGIARRRRERELLVQHGRDWAPRGGDLARFAFRRGFVEAVAIPVSALHVFGEPLFEAAPLLSSLTVTGLRGPTAEDYAARPVDVLVRSPGFSRIRRLELNGTDDRGRYTTAGDRLAAQLVALGALSQLRALGISSFALTTAGATTLAASGQLGQLEHLRLTGDIGVSAAVALLRAAPRITALELTATADVGLMHALGPVVALRLELGVGNVLRDAASRALQRSAAAQTLESLAIDGNFAPADGFAAFPRLRHLDVSHTRHPVSWTGSRFDAFVGTPLPALRELVCSGYLKLPKLIAIARAFGPQLELLDARPASIAFAEVLAPLVAGDILLGAWPFGGTAPVIAGEVVAVDLHRVAERHRLPFDPTSAQLRSLASSADVRALL
jgi:uncharacterized protein (TIGR02996 family)